MWFHKYRVAFSIDGNPNREEGIVVGKTYADAVEKIEEYYKDIVDVYIEQYGEREDILPRHELLEVFEVKEVQTDVNSNGLR